MNIRPATFDDLPGILEIYNDAVLNTTATYDCAPRTLEHRVAWFEEHERQRLPVFVAVDAAGRVLGWSSLSRYHDRRGYQFTVENSVYVAAAERGRGVGKLLLASGKVAKKLDLSESGYRVVINSGPDAGESVPHLHLHVLGKRVLAWPPG